MKNQNLLISDAADRAATPEEGTRTRGEETEEEATPDIGQGVAVLDGRNHLKRVNLR